MKKLAVAGLVLAASVVFAPVAFAQQSPAQAPSSGCGAALVALAQAEKAAAEADAADKAAADAKKADDAAADAKVAAKAASDAQFVYSQAPYNDPATPARIDELRANADNPAWVNVPDRIVKIEAVLATKAAQTNADAAAAKTDAEALRREADKTDAPALTDAAKRAEAVADKACGRTDGQPVRFENCDEVRAAGKAPLPASDPDYRVGLDSDRDGLACESTENTVTPTPSAPRLPAAVDTGRA